MWSTHEFNRVINMNCKFPSPSCNAHLLAISRWQSVCLLISWHIVSFILLYPARRALEALMSFQLSVTRALSVPRMHQDGDEMNPPQVWTSRIRRIRHAAVFADPFFGLSTRVQGLNLFALKCHKSQHSPKYCPLISHAPSGNTERQPQKEPFSGVDCSF